MSIVPDKIMQKIQYCEDHIAPFTTNATAIGTTSAIVTDFQTKTEAARTALTTQSEARQAAKVATNALSNAVIAMSNAMADIIKQVRAKAGQSGDGVYDLAQIPPPATPSTKPVPGTPFQLKVALDGNGALNLKWKCNNPAGTSGTLYQVWRQIGEAGTLEYLGGSGSKSFVDATLPAGSTNVMYQIQAVRTTAVGQFATFNVKFGVSGTGGGGAMSATVTEGTPRKIAA